MNHNPDMNDLDTWLTWWRESSLNAMKAHRANRANLFLKVITPIPSDLTEEEFEALKRDKDKIWECLNDRRNIVLSTPEVKTQSPFTSRVLEEV